MEFTTAVYLLATSLANAATHRDSMVLWVEGAFMVTMEERVTQLERTSDATLEIVKSHGEALARLDAKIDARFDAVSEDISAVKEDVAWIRQKLGSNDRS